MNLRTRRKIETTKQIHEVAVKLASEQGTDGVTIEAICEAAGISRRTFFNYFPFKEAALVFPAPPPSEEASARFLAAEADIMSDIIVLMVEHIRSMNEVSGGAGLVTEIGLKYPRVMPLQMAEFLKFEIELSTLIAKRLGLQEEDIQASTLAGAFIGAARTARSKLNKKPRADLPELLRKALEDFVLTMRSNDLP